MDYQYARAKVLEDEITAFVVGIKANGGTWKGKKEDVKKVIPSFALVGTNDWAEINVLLKEIAIMYGLKLTSFGYEKPFIIKV